MLGITTKGELVEIDPEKPKTQHNYVAFVVFQDEEVPRWGRSRMFDAACIDHPPLRLYFQRGLHKSLHHFRLYFAEEWQSAPLYKRILGRRLYWARQAIDQLLAKLNIQNSDSPQPRQCHHPSLYK